MAIVNPAVLPSVRKDGGLFRELETISHLQQALPDNYEIFHSVFIHNVQEGVDRHGEIDVVIMGPTGNLLLMEIKAGSVVVRDGHMIKSYGTREHDVDRQCKIQYMSMISRLTAVGLRPFVNRCLVLPNYTVTDASLVSMPRERIIDANDYATIGEKALHLLNVGKSASEVDAVRQFLNNDFQVAVDLTVLGEQLRRTTTLMSDGLASWVPRITAPSKTVRVQATAGSGKTQLAMRLIEDAIGKDLSVLYVCFNRTLADHMIKMAPARAMVVSFHELCTTHYRRHREEPDFTDSSIFDRAVTAYLEDSLQFPPKYDVLIIDEAQDFDPSWFPALFVQLKSEGLRYVLEDADQQLYGRQPFELSDAVVVSSRENYRSPKVLCDVINALKLSSTSIQSRSPYLGNQPDFLSYVSESDLIVKTTLGVILLLEQGFKMEEIAVLTGYGQGKSTLLKLNQIGTHAVLRFTGSYDKRGEPLWTDGALLVETLYRYKGQSAKAVVLAEIDFEELTPREKAKLFVGMTRARMALVIVLSARAEACLAQLLAD
jgi:hypothetical protein